MQVEPPSPGIYFQASCLIWPTIEILVSAVQQVANQTAVSSRYLNSILHTRSDWHLRYTESAMLRLRIS